MKKERCEWLDFERGILILLVVVGHVLGKWIEPMEVTEFIYKIIYSFHMPAFFMISGYAWARFSKDKIVNIKNYIGRKAISLLIPYALFSIGFGALKMFAGADNTISPIGIKDIILFPIRPFDYLWFLYALFIVECIIAWCFKQLSISTVWVLAVCIILHFVSCFVQIEWVAIGRILCFMVYFVLGILALEHEQKEINENVLRRGLVFVAFFVMEGFYVILCKDNAETTTILPSALIVFICGMLGSASVFLASKFLGKWLRQGRCKALVGLGKYSIIFYLVHQPVISIIRVLLIKLNYVTPLWQIVFMFGGTMLISAFVCYLAKKFSFVDFFFYPGKYIKK